MKINKIILVRKMIEEIRKKLNKKSSQDIKESMQKSIPTAKNIYGVKVPVINQLARDYKSGGLSLAKKLWESNRFEEKLLTAKIIKKIGNKNPDRTWKIVKKFSKQIDDWAVCDTLANQGLKRIISNKEEEIFNFAKKSIHSKNSFQRRFSIVLFINLLKNNYKTEEIKKVIDKVENDEDHYVSKALDWINKEINKEKENAKTEKKKEN